jgi:nitroimidazol reductase NimA-like FMN-containing flavoprotein (pyridoxamine 5'-phosphate oxidase superfamily)
MLGTLNEAQIEMVLRRETIGRIGCHADGRTYVVPVTYAYDGEAVYAHSAEGLKLRVMRKNPRVCFEVEHVDSLAEWRCVIAQGEFEELAGAAASAAMELLITRLAPLTTGETNTPTFGFRGDGPERDRRPCVYRVRLVERTGRFEKR